MIGVALAAAAVVARPCGLPPGWAAIAARHTRYVIFGETHGTEQAPALVGQVACALAKQHERVLIAIEQDSGHDAAFQLVWAGPDESFGPALRRVPGWKGQSDGVASEAMFAMLVRLHHLNARQKNVDVVLFNGAKNDAQRARYASLPNQGPHEAAQAENIRVAAAEHGYDHVLVLTGSLHARKEPMDYHGPAFLPMAMQLAPVSQTTSLRLYSGSGTMWNCIEKPGTVLKPGEVIPADAIECGKHSASSMAPLFGAPFMALGRPARTDPDGHYDGYVWLGPITGSPPAVPDNVP